jgi:hypothetical protein
MTERQAGTARQEVKVLGLATQGSGSGDEVRLQELLAAFTSELIPFVHGALTARILQVTRVVRQVLRTRPDLVVMEGTGVAGGLALLLARVFGHVPYIVSSGDAVGPFIGARHPKLGPVFTMYERLLYRMSAGAIGWTPYITGRALTFGAPRAVTAPGWPKSLPTSPQRTAYRAETRRALGISDDAIVAGIAGAIIWNSRYSYCYGMELVAAARTIKRDDLHIVVVGDGTGLDQLHRSAGELVGRRVHLVGRVPSSDVVRYLAAMDVGSLPQSRDGLGSFRYSTKLSEYLGAGLPVVTGRVPLAYDLDQGWLWRLPGWAPWTATYTEALAQLLDGLKPEEIQRKRENIAVSLQPFDKGAQQARVTAFLAEVIEEQRAATVHDEGRESR